MDNRQEHFSSAQRMRNFEHIFHANHPAVFQFLCRLLPTAEDVEDCLQETFLRFWRSSSSYEDQGKLKAYILKIARNLAIDHLRHNQSSKNRTRSLQEMEPLEAKEDRNVKEKQTLLSMVRDKVDQLPLSQRETFLLFRYHGMSYQQIAEIQGVSIKTVDSRLYRAMKQLGQQLKGLSKFYSEGKR